MNAVGPIAVADHLHNGSRHLPCTRSSGNRRLRRLLLVVTFSTTVVVNIASSENELSIGRMIHEAKASNIIPIEKIFASHEAPEIKVISPRRISWQHFIHSLDYIFSIKNTLSGHNNTVWQLRSAEACCWCRQQCGRGHDLCENLGYDGKRTTIVTKDRGRDVHYCAPPAQIRTCGFPAYGSHLGCLTAKRALGQG